MAEKKKRFFFFKGKGEKQEQLHIDEDALREFEAVLHAEMEAEDRMEDLVPEADQPLNEADDEQENLDELEMEVERSLELHPEEKPEAVDRVDETNFETDPEQDRAPEACEDVQETESAARKNELAQPLKEDPRETAWQDTLKVKRPLEESLQEQLDELKQIRSGIPEERRAWIHEEAVRKANQGSGEAHYRRRRRQPPKSSPKKWLWIVVLAFITVVWFFWGSIMEVMPSFERTEQVETVDPESQLRERVDLFFSTAKVIEAESMTSFFSMTTMDDPQNYESNREAINALIDLKTSFELVQELQYLGIAGLQMEMVEDLPTRALVSVEVNSVEPVLKAALAETTWLYKEGQWVMDAEQYLADLKEAQIALDQVPVLPPEDNSDLPAGQVITAEPEPEAEEVEPETVLTEQPQATEETEDGFIQAGGFSYRSESSRDFSMLTLKFGIQKEGFEKMVFTSAEAKLDQEIDAPSFEMWLSEDNIQMTVKIDAGLSDLEMADYKRYSALIQHIELDQETKTMVFTFKEAVQVRPYEWKGLVIMDYEEKE